MLKSFVGKFNLTTGYSFFCIFKRSPNSTRWGSACSYPKKQAQDAEKLDRQNEPKSTTKKHNMDQTRKTQQPANRQSLGEIN